MKTAEITVKDPQINAYHNVDYSAGLILLGKFQEVKDRLLSPVKSRLTLYTKLLFAERFHIHGK